MLARARAEGRPTDKLAAGVRNTVALFDETLAALRDGGPAPLSLSAAKDAPRRMCPPSTGEVHAQLQKVTELWTPFRAKVEAALSGGPEAGAAVTYVEGHNVPLLKQMNKGVGMMQKVAEGKLAGLEQMLTASLVIAAFVAALALAFAVALGRLLLRVLAAADDVSHRIAAGDVRARVPVDLPFMLPEFSELIGRLNDTCDGYTELLERVPMPMLTTDERNEIRFANAASRARIGERVEGRPIEARLGRLERGAVVRLEGGSSFRVQAESLARGERRGNLTCLVDETESRATLDLLRAEVEGLEQMLKCVAEGNLGVRYHVQSSSQGAQEEREAFLAIEQATEAALSRLGGLLGSVRSSSEALGQSSTELDELGRAVSEHVRRTTEEVGGARSEIEAIGANATEVADSMNGLRDGMARVSDSARGALGVVTRAQSAAGRADELLRNFETASRQVSNIIAMISDVADQTQILALNASIESASAGEAGRGFALVAKEVKDLAKRTHNAADQASEQVRSAQGSAKEAVRALEEVVGVINEICDLQQRITEEVDDNQATTQRVADKLGQVHDATRKLERAMHQLSECSDSAISQTQATEGASRRVANLARTLDDELQRFQLEAA